MIPVKNIYYMLSYAFRVLREQEYRNVATEEFDNVLELYAAILIRGVTLQVKRGLGRSYIAETDELASPRGKFDLARSIKEQSLRKKRLVCTYDEFSVDFPMNQILRSTVELLLRSQLSAARKKELRKLMVYFGEVSSIDLYSVNWNMRFHRNNQSYRMLIAVCHLIFKGLLQTEEEGPVRMMSFLDDRTMNLLYENFLYEYFRQEHPELRVSAPVIRWQLDDDMRDFLPRMETDVYLTRGDRILILDAKFYNQAMQVQYGKYKNRSGNLYQIFTYVKNKQYELELENEVRKKAGDAPLDFQVAGMLLYAMTDEEVHPNQEYRMSGNLISVKSLDLNQEFSRIRRQLDDIAEDYFGS